MRGDTSSVFQRWRVKHRGGGCKAKVSLSLNHQELQYITTAYSPFPQQFKRKENVAITQEPSNACCCTGVSVSSIHKVQRFSASDEVIKFSVMSFGINWTGHVGDTWEHFCFLMLCGVFSFPRSSEYMREVQNWKCQQNTSRYRGGSRILVSGALSTKFSQNRVFFLKIAWKLHDFEKILGTKWARAPRAPWIRQDVQ